MSIVRQATRVVGNKEYFDAAGALILIDHIDDALERLAKRVEKTYRSHLAMAKRLQRRDRHWSFALVSLSIVTTLCGVAMIGDPTIYGDRGSSLWALIGVCSLAASLIIANASYNARSHEALRAYRLLQRQWTDIDYDHQHVRSAGKRRRLASKHNSRYQELLDSMPNHSSADYYSVVHVTRKKGVVDIPLGKSFIEHATLVGQLQIYAERTLSIIGTAIPLALAALAGVALVPIAIWINNG
ncbi:SLATT domain-containing protein [Clavibacter michiganensis]|uniref:SLATT domain-containing protein n=1 Tax=Clavibacter michiganensis TaxID=28447 RepID=UPI00117FCF67|nr:SLATT domain-containing protein [Clavibacter michiganensis]